MGEEKKRNRVPISLGVLCIVLAVLLILMTLDYIPTLSGSGGPYLINVSLGASDEGNGVMRIQGFVVNGGGSTANNAKLHVVAYYVSGAKAIDTMVQLGSGTIAGRESVRVDTTVNYSSSGGIGVAAATATLAPEYTR